MLTGDDPAAVKGHDAYPSTLPELRDWQKTSVAANPRVPCGTRLPTNTKRSVHVQRTLVRAPKRARALRA